jgi:putative acetyltransferase
LRSEAYYTWWNPVTHPARIRQATLCDAEAICAVHVASIRGLCAADYTAQQIDGWAGAKHPERYRRAMAEGERMFVAEVPSGEAGNVVVGLAGVHGNEVRAVYVHPDHVGRGVGGALLGALEEQARSDGFETLVLHSTLNARAFYLKHAYRDEGETVFELRPGLHLPCVKMTKALATPPTIH